MKKLLLSLSAAALLATGAVHAQVYTLSMIGQNPMRLNTDGENPGSLMVTNSNWVKITEWSNGAAAAYTSVTALPFDFTFNGSIFTHFKASNSGCFTFDTATTILPAYGNTALPSANIPDNSINVLGIKPINNATYKSSIITKTFGTAPNRQFWVQYNFFSEPNIQNGWTYWAIVLEETSNKVYIVDMKTLCVTTSGSLCTGNVKISAGIQMNSTTAYSINGSPNLAANNNATNLFDASDNKYYEFISGTQPGIDMSVVNINNEAFAVNKLTQVYGKIRNLGSQAVTSFTLNYQLGADAAVSTNITGINIGASGDVYTFVHPTPINIAAAGTKNLKVWASNINGGTDENTTNDELAKDVLVSDNLRISLHEIFSSSTCGPCAPGNANYKAIVADRDKNLFTSIKYQQDFPGTGDPYSTKESVARRGYYGINSIPRMEIDGQWDGNAQSFTNSLFNQYQTIAPALKMNATYRVLGNAIDVNVKLNAVAALTGTNKLYVAVIEGKTTKNLKSNGEKEFFHVMKKMLPNEQGTAITGLEVGVDKEYNFMYTFNGNYTLAPNGQSPINLATENSVEEFEDLEVIVFVQSSTKLVLQSAEAERSQFWAVGLNETNSEMQLGLYPNPANNSFVVASPVTNRAGMVRVMDITGKEVIANHFVEFNKTHVDCNALKPGIYFVQVESEGKAAIQKLVISK